MRDIALLCPYVGGPPLNTDVSGIGVRISFYVQTLLLGELIRFYGEQTKFDVIFSVLVGAIKQIR